MHGSDGRADPHFPPGTKEAGQITSEEYLELSNRIDVYLTGNYTLKELKDKLSATSTPPLSPPKSENKTLKG